MPTSIRSWEQNEAFVLDQFKLEETRFCPHAASGRARVREGQFPLWARSKVIDGMVAFNLYATYGFPD